MTSGNVLPSDGVTSPWWLKAGQSTASPSSPTASTSEKSGVSFGFGFSPAVSDGDKSWLSKLLSKKGAATDLLEQLTEGAYTAGSRPDFTAVRSGPDVTSQFSGGFNVVGSVDGNGTNITYFSTGTPPRGHEGRRHHLRRLGIGRQGRSDRHRPRLPDRVLGRRTGLNRPLEPAHVRRARLRGRRRRRARWRADLRPDCCRGVPQPGTRRWWRQGRPAPWSQGCSWSGWPTSLLVPRRRPSSADSAGATIQCGTYRLKMSSIT